MATAFELAVAVGLAIATVNAYFSRRDGNPPADVLRTFVGWLLAFVVAGLLARPVAAWLLTHVF